MKYDKKVLEKELDKFYSQIEENINELLDFIDITANAYKTRESLRNVLSGIDFPSQNQDRNSEKIISKLDTEIAKFENFSEINRKLAFVSLISHFEVYFKNVLKIIFKLNYREFYSSDKKQISYKELLTFSNDKSLFENLIEKEVYSYAYKSIRNQIEELNKKYNIEFSKNGLTNKEIYIDKVQEIYSTRNIILHNNGVVNDKYLEINNNSKFQKGEKRLILPEYFNESSSVLQEYAKVIFDVVSSRILKVATS